MRRIPLIFLLVSAFSFTARKDVDCNTSSLFKRCPFPVGAALDTEKLKFEERYWKTALEHFNSFTPERVMKPDHLHPREDVFNFSELDHLMDFCKEHKVRLHGHTLVWHKSLPSWMENFEGNKSDWENLLRKHISVIVGHCKGKVKSWDVVNEAFNDDGTLRQNIWLKNIGPDYLALAFTFAHEADQDALLFYNDYSMEVPAVKLGAVIAKMKEIRSQGSHVDGIGMQMHVTLDFPAINDINAAAQDIAREGFMVHYSELDVSLTAGQGFFVSGKKLMEEQRCRLRNIVKGYMQLETKYRFGVTFWGVSDNDSWLTEDKFRARPLLFDSRYKPKPAFCGFIEGLEEK
jgi:endo-1,4-beta-xylanase